MTLTIQHTHRWYTQQSAEAEAVNEAFPKPIEDLTTVDGWVHHELELNKLGRTRPLPEVEEEEGRVTSTEEPPEEIAPLRSLADDEKGTWGFRTTPAGAGAGPNSAVSCCFLVLSCTSVIYCSVVY
jgi:hypothetical protein